MRVPPPADDYPAVLERALAALETTGRDQAETELESIAWARTAVAGRTYLPRITQGLVFRRDRFACRYCGARVIPIPIMELLGTAFGDRFPYHPNWKGGETHPAVLSRTAVIDHIEPVSRGGPPTHEDNLVTACWPCNARKGDLSLDRLGWDLLPADRGDWDGLTRYYGRLWLEAGQPNPRLHADWMRALGVDATSRPLP